MAFNVNELNSYSTLTGQSLSAPLGVYKLVALGGRGKDDGHSTGKKYGKGGKITGTFKHTSSFNFVLTKGAGGKGGADCSGGRLGNSGGDSAIISMGSTNIIRGAGGGGEGGYGSSTSSPGAPGGNGGYPGTAGSTANSGTNSGGSGGTAGTTSNGYSGGGGQCYNSGEGDKHRGGTGTLSAGGGGGGGHSNNASGKGGGGGCNYFASSVTNVTHETGVGTAIEPSAQITLMATAPTIQITSISNNVITLKVNYKSAIANEDKKVEVNIHNSWTTIHSTSSSSYADFTVNYSVPQNVDKTITFRVNNTQFTSQITCVYDNVAPTISFPQETYNVQHYEGETVALFIGTDTNDKDLDYDYKVYVDGGLYTSQTNLKDNTFKLPYFDTMPESYQLKVEVRAKQSSDTTNGTNTDIWSEWYTSPTITIKSPVIFIPNFTTIKWYQDVEQQVITSPFTEFETKHYCNGELFTTTPHFMGITPPLLYTPIKPHLWSYEYYAVTRAKNTQGQWSGWYKSPVVEVQFNVQPNDITFSKEIPKYFIEGEIVTIEWDESIDPNSTKTTYTVSLMNNTTEELLEFRGVEEPRLTFTVPKGIISDKVTLGIVAYSDGLYSNPVSSPNLAITDVKVMDCTLDFPRLTTNVLGEFKKLILEINNDRRIEFEDNLDNYLLPLHYFRKGENILTLIATDRNDVEITRSWKVTLDFNLQDLEQVNKIDLKGFMSFNHNESEQYVPCTTLFKPNLDLGVVEHELYGSTTFEGADSITQKLVITRDANDDISQLRTLKITGAIE